MKISSCKNDFWVRSFLMLTLLVGYAKGKTIAAGSPEHVLLTTRSLTVSGIVTDRQGDPIEGVSIQVKGTKAGASTNKEGRFSIDVQEGSVLVFSYVGYDPQEIRVTKTGYLTIALDKSENKLDEVVTIGYGKLKSNKVTSAIAKITSKDIDNRPVSRIDQAMQGKIAGVQVQEVSGAPGRAMNVRIRGTGSINYSGNPLYVVDGFPLSGDLNNINPGDIESIEVLKDAASAAIYGSRGSNGVVLITTKSGKAGKNLIELDSYVGLQERFSKVAVMNRDQYIDYAIEERTNSYLYNGGNPAVPEPNRQAYQYAIDPLWRTAPKSFPDNDWQNLISRKAVMQNYTLSTSGGTDKTRYFISGNYLDQDGIILNTGYKRYSVRANVRTSPTKWFTMGLNLAAANSRRDDPNTDTNGGPISRSILMAPIVGKEQQTVDGGYYYYHASFYLNPIYMAKQTFNRVNSNRLLSNMFAEVTPLKNLVFRSSFGTDIISEQNPFYIMNNVNRGAGSYATLTNTLTQNFLSENTLSYNTRLDQVDLNLLGGFTYQEETYDYSTFRKTGFPDDDIQTLNAGTVLVSGTSTKEKWSLLSYLARANVSYRDKYVFSTSIRRDGSSRFGKDNRWGIFPSASLGWIMSEESFMDGTRSLISNLKLRASLGTAGNNNIGNYSAIGLMSPANYVVGSNAIGGYALSSFGNSSLGWEKTTTTDIGVDIGLLKNRINLTVDYYVANTKDLLLQVPIPQVTGFSTALQNIGKVQNRGVEIELLTNNLTGRFRWSTTFNISFNKNKVVQLGPDGSPIIGYSSGFPITITRIGDPIGSYYLFKTDGLFKDQTDVDNNKAMAYVSSHPSPGDLKYKDINGDKKITVDDKTIVGHNNPDYFWGLTNNFSYANFDLSIFMDAQAGNKLLNLGKKETTQSRANVRSYWLDRWRSADHPGNGRVPRAVTTENLTTPSDWWLEDAAFWRIRSINLGYTFNQKLLSKLGGITQVKAYLGIDNVFMHDHYNHMSQTATFANSGLTPGIDYDAGYPLARTYRLGINLKF